MVANITRKAMETILNRLKLFGLLTEKDRV